jgi:hypothetical protein
VFEDIKRTNRQMKTEKGNQMRLELTTIRARAPWKRAAVMAVLIAFATSLAADVPARTSQRRQVAKPAMSRRQQSIFDQGYNKGYGEGYVAGEKDWNKSAARDYLGSEAYLNRRQSFDPAYAELEQYRQGFELGFELGYTDAYFGRARNAAIPPNAEVLGRAAVIADAQRNRSQQQQPEPAQQAQPASPAQEPQSQPAPEDQTRPRTTADAAPQISIPGGAEFKLRLGTLIDTKDARVGDKFNATVLNPSNLEGAFVEGHISKLNRSGRLTGKTELALQFDSITINDQPFPFRAELVRIYESEKVKQVDEEGNVETSSRTSDTTKRSTIGAVAGAVLGGIAGGGKGAAIGAVIGAGAGAGTVLIEGNKDLRLEPGTEMLVRTEEKR